MQRTPLELHSMAFLTLGSLIKRQVLQGAEGQLYRRSRVPYLRAGEAHIHSPSTPSRTFLECFACPWP